MGGIDEEAIAIQLFPRLGNVVDYLKSRRMYVDVIVVIEMTQVDAYIIG